MFLALTIPCIGYQIAMAKNGTNEVNKVTSVQQQQKKRVVTGVITDAADGSPIVGATIRLKGTSAGVISDLNGAYSIQINNSKSALLISYIGYKTREIPVEDLAVINIKLQSDNEMLDEVVVVGSGTQKSKRYRCYFYCKRFGIEGTKFIIKQFYGRTLGWCIR